MTGGPTRPLCVTVTLWPAIVTVALRDAFAVFVEIFSATLPGPEPPPLSVNHAGAPEADHVHPDCVVTVTAAVAAEARTDTLTGATAYVHAAVAVCVTVKVLPAIVSVPVRLAPELLVATMNVTVPFPLPGPALMTATQATLLTAAHAQVAAAVTTLLPEPPFDVNDRLAGEIDAVQVLTGP